MVRGLFQHDTTRWPYGNQYQERAQRSWLGRDGMYGSASSTDYVVIHAMNMI